MTQKPMTWEEAVVWLKGQPDQVDLVRACFYDDPLIQAAKRYYYSTEWRAVKAFLPKEPGRALDLGAGRGISSYALAKEGWEVTALEPDHSTVVGAGAIRSLSQETGLRINVVENWGENLPFPDETFDCVHGRQVLHHAKDLKQLCREINRVLKRGGILIATREHVISRESDLGRFQATHPLHHLYGGEHAYLLKGYLAAIRNAGIRIRFVLNPYASDINLYPETRESMKNILTRALRLPGNWMIPDILLRCWGAMIDVPGRLYTFVGYKPSGR